MMLTFRRPTADQLMSRVDSLREATLTYPLCNGSSPPGFLAESFEQQLGHGEETYRAGCQAIRDWRMFPESMAELWPKRVPLEPGQIVCVLFRAGPVWTANPCRIVRVIDDDGARKRFGFVYGTLPGHVERGEEQFLIEWDCRDDTVKYSITLFSRPAHWLIWLGYPYARRQQKRFRRLSGQSMLQSISEI